MLELGVGRPVRLTVSTGLLVPTAGDALLALIGQDSDPIVLAFGIGVMINRDSRGHSYFIVRVGGPQSQSFSRGYGSILSTSLAYIVPSTRGCSPWRPDAVMSTTGHGRHSVLRILKGHRGHTGHHATCGALPAAGPYLRLSRFQGGQAIKQKR
ncbi:hypothetical protein V6N13_057410 [Hibiscus sabdariffa]